MLADAGRASLELCHAVLAHHLMILSLLALDDNMIPLWSLGRGHSNEYGACGSSWGVVRGWSEELPEFAVIYNCIKNVSRLFHVYYRMERPWGPYDPTLALTRTPPLPRASMDHLLLAVQVHFELQCSLANVSISNAEAGSYTERADSNVDMQSSTYLPVINFG